MSSMGLCVENKATQSIVTCNSVMITDWLAFSRLCINQKRKQSVIAKTLLYVPPAGKKSNSFCKCSSAGSALYSSAQGWGLPLGGFHHLQWCKAVSVSSRTNRILLCVEKTLSKESSLWWLENIQDFLKWH